MPDYEYDIFISYRRLGDAPTWIDRHLIPVLKNALAPELGREPDIFYDDGLETGGTWPVELGANLAKSKILLCLWSKTFLQSPWCTKELAIMWQRERDLQLRTPENPEGTVALSIIHDGETIPGELNICQKLQMADYYNPMMNEDSPNREKFLATVQSKAASLGNMITGAPDYQRNWELEAAEEFYDLFFQEVEARQQTPPRFTT